MIFEDFNDENQSLHANHLLGAREGNSQLKNILVKEMNFDIEVDTLSKTVIQAFEKLVQEVRARC